MAANKMLLQCTSSYVPDSVLEVLHKALLQNGINTRYRILDKVGLRVCGPVALFTVLRAQRYKMFKE